MGIKIRTFFVIVVLQMLNMISCQEVAKRVPQGFLGVRGKKYYDTEEVEHLYKRKPQFFVGVKGKKNILDYLQSNYEQYYKRAPMGFIGMRGKKDSDEFAEQSPFSSLEYVPKRGSLIGQIDYSAEEVPEIDYGYINELLQEYERQRELKNSLEEANDHSAMMTKRATKLNQFFGVRGKKANKRPFDLSFRGKFVGVRGKKDLGNLNEVKFLMNNEAPWPKRKGQMNGFFGMRGKKWMEESGNEIKN